MVPLVIPFTGCHHRAEVSETPGVEQRVGVGGFGADLQAGHGVVALRQFELLAAQLTNRIPQTKVGEEVVLAVELDRCAGALSRRHQRGEVHVDGDVGCSRLGQGVGAEVVVLIGPEGALRPTRLELLGGAAVVDNH